jgi:hypothetical protein
MRNFKKCNVCKSSWESRENFLSDPDVEIIGYQANFSEPNEGLFLFNHICGTTLSAQVKVFGTLYDGPRYKEILTGSEDCKGLCLNEKDSSLCIAECNLAFAREIIKIIRNWEKQL